MAPETLARELGCKISFTHDSVIISGFTHYYTLERFAGCLDGTYDWETSSKDWTVSYRIKPGKTVLDAQIELSEARAEQGNASSYVHPYLVRSEHSEHYTLQTRE